MKQKIQALLNQLNHGLVEREAALKAAMLAMLTGIDHPAPPKACWSERRIAEGVGEDERQRRFRIFAAQVFQPKEIVDASRLPNTRLTISGQCYELSPNTRQTLPI